MLIHQLHTTVAFDIAPCLRVGKAMRLPELINQRNDLFDLISHWVLLCIDACAHISKTISMVCLQMYEL